MCHRPSFKLVSRCNFLNVSFSFNVKWVWEYIWGSNDLSLLKPNLHGLLPPHSFLVEVDRASDGKPNLDTLVFSWSQTNFIQMICWGIISLEGLSHQRYQRPWHVYVPDLILKLAGFGLCRSSIHLEPKHSCMGEIGNVLPYVCRHFCCDPP